MKNAVCLAALILVASCRTGADTAPPPGPALVGTEWRLVALGAEPVLADAVPTLVLDGAGGASGHGGCNRWFGAVELDGDAVAFGALGATRMACEAAVLEQEGAYLSALESARRLERSGSSLWLYAAGDAAVLTFEAGPPAGG